MEDAKERADKILSDHKKALEQSFEEHQKQEQKRFDLQLKIEQDKINREGNKHLSLEQIRLRSQAGNKRAKLKEDLQAGLTEMLLAFRQTDSYLDLLKNRIQKALDFAKEDPVKIYIDSEDTTQYNILKELYQDVIYQSKYPFLGGIRAVIESRNILIDHSFEKRIEEVFEHFQFEFGGEHE